MEVQHCYFVTTHYTIKHWKNCSEKLRLNEEIINKCYTTGFRYKTAHLKPPHEYVPWVVENNQPLRQDLEKFVKYVCQAYKGDHKPGACKAQSSSLSSTIHASFAETHPPATPVIDFYKLALQLPPSAAWHFNCLLQLAALV
ncbi:hypothetical protein V6Z11_A10G268300 [Gossypium hirsutum]